LNKTFNVMMPKEYPLDYDGWVVSCKF
jgi:hypothetical protein